MRRASIVLASLLVFGLTALPALSSEAAKGKSHDVTVEFVKYDATAKTVTFKTEAGEEKTAPVMENAMKGFETLKPGEKIVLTCMDNEAGEHQAISMVKPAKAEKKA
jgi:hypothetical protein